MTPSQVLKRTCSIWTAKPEYHSIPKEGVSLRLSPYIRNFLHDGASFFGMTAGKLKICMILLFTGRAIQLNNVRVPRAFLTK